MRLTKHHGVAALILVGACIFLLPVLATVYTDWLWFEEVQLQDVFLRRIGAQAVFGAMFLAVAFAVLFFNFRLAQRALKSRSFTVFSPEGPRTISLDMTRLRPVFTFGALAVSVLIAM